ncbi:MAG: sugar phosphate nucleotidyltransferase [Dehalococcoidales bacterium]|nr:sugar phosphate nucleotidyltransferase [Dehalococcoidales bacterium]
MKAVILAAGEGSRMRPLTYTRPKVMLPLANRPILEHLLIAARQAGINDFVFVVGYRDEQVRDYFGDGERWGVSIDYVAQRKQLGTADAIKMAEGLVTGNFLVMNGDMLVNQSDISGLASQNHNTLGVFETGDTTGLGVVTVTGERIVRIYEKTESPPSHLANAGLYLFTPDIFPAISRTPKSPRGEYEITTTLQSLIDQGQSVRHHKIDYWLDLSYPWDLLSANESLMAGMTSGNLGEIEDNVVTKGMVSIGQGTVVRAGSYIVGPVIIGQHCEIGPNCYIRPCTAIGDDCHLGGAVEVKNSIVMKGTKIPHHNYVGDSIIGEGCNLGAGTKIANLRLDKGNIRVDGIDTRRRKLGAIIGDRVETGINVSINTGTVIGNNTWIGPGAVVSGVISPDSMIF